MGDFLLILAGAYLLSLLFPKKKPVPPVLDDEFEGRIAQSQGSDGGEYCKEFITSGIMEKGIYDPAILPEGLCIIGEANLDGEVFTIGNKFAIEQAEQFMQRSDVFRELSKANSVTFVLTNQSNAVANIEILKSDSGFDSSLSTGITVTGLLDFDGDDNVSLGNVPFLPPNYTLNFKLYLDNDSGYSTSTGIISLGNTTVTGAIIIVITLDSNKLGIYALVNGGSSTNDQFSITGLSGTILECVATVTSGLLTSFTINGTAQSSIGSSASQAISTIQHFGYGIIYCKDATIWDISIDDSGGTVLHSWAGQPAGNTDAAWLDTGYTTYSGVMVFAGATTYINLGTFITITGIRRVSFYTYVTGTGTNRCIFDFGNVVTDKLSAFVDTGDDLLINIDNAGGGKKYDFSSFLNKIVFIEIIKGVGSVTSVSIDGVAQTSIGGSGSAASYPGYIGYWGGFFGFTGNIWDLKVYDNSDNPQHHFKGYPAGNTSAAWTDLVGVLTPTVIGSPTTTDRDTSINGTVQGTPSTRDVTGGGITTPPSDSSQGANPGSISYESINRDFSVNPIMAFHLKVITTTTAQLLQLLQIKNSMVTGSAANENINIQNFVSSENAQAQIVDIPLEKPIYLDRNTYFELPLEASESVSLVFYYQQLDQKDKLIPIDLVGKPPL